MVVEKSALELCVGGRTDGTRPDVGTVGDGERAVKNEFQVGLSFWQLVLPLAELRNNEEGCCKEDQRVVLVLTC